jgi:transposase
VRYLPKNLFEIFYSFEKDVGMSKARAKEKRYPSDLTEEQFERIRALLESSRARTKPLGTDLREVFNAVLYVLKEGCRWRSLPTITRTGRPCITITTTGEATWTRKAACPCWSGS